MRHGPRAHDDGEVRFVVAGGKRLEVRSIARASLDATPERPTLVFLHEGLGSAGQWRDFPARLAAACGCDALVYSRAGYGRSESTEVPRPLTYMHDEGLVTLPALLDACRVHTCVLVGHSDGASIAIVHAGSARDREPRAVHADTRVRGLILEAPHVFTEPHGLASIARAREAYVTGDLRARLAKHHDDVDAAFWGWNRAWLDPGFVAWNLEAYLPGIDAPVLVVQGEDDPYGTIAQVDAVERGVRGRFARVILPGCGHAPHRERPEATLDAMTRLVRSLAGGAIGVTRVRTRATRDPPRSGSRSRSSSSPGRRGSGTSGAPTRGTARSTRRRG
jgi:pimeloyl-ACP methyl ester carboxylesterase